MHTERQKWADIRPNVTSKLARSAAALAVSLSVLVPTQADSKENSGPIVELQSRTALSLTMGELKNKVYVLQISRDLPSKEGLHASQMDIPNLASDGLISGEATIDEASFATAAQAQPEEEVSAVGNFKITGYYCDFDSGYYGDGGHFCNAMASGKIVYQGAAACGNSYPFGTVFRIEGYGDVVCDDRGAFSSYDQSHLDVWFHNSSQLATLPSTAEVSIITLK